MIRHFVGVSTPHKFVSVRVRMIELVLYRARIGCFLPRLRRRWRTGFPVSRRAALILSLLIVVSSCWLRMIESCSENFFSLETKSAILPFIGHCNKFSLCFFHIFDSELPFQLFIYMRARMFVLTAPNYLCGLSWNFPV